VYVYPAGDPFTGRLRGEFVATEASLSELHPAALRDSGAVVRAPGPDGPAVGFEARFRLLASDGGQGTLAQVFQCGRWFLKLRATYAGGYAIDGALAAMHEQVRCPDLAARTPIGTTGNIEYDPAGGPEWLVYGATQLVWLKEHVAPAALAFGIPDHEPGLFVESFEAMLDAREQAVASGGAAPNPFLDRLREIRAAGFLEAYVWRTLLGFLPPPRTLAPQLEAFESWRERALPAHRHEVYAGVRLVD
jgi:hypothetical protein